jgi:hypothetical protein
VAQRRHLFSLDRGEEPSEAAAGRLVQEDPLDRCRSAELERLLQGRFGQVLDD